MKSDIELNRACIDIEWLCKIWGGLEVYPLRGHHLHGIFLATPSSSPIFDDIFFLYGIAEIRGCIRNVK
jgi:hypothetical protein